MEISDNAIEFIKGSKRATVTFSQGKYIRRILTLAKTHPEVEIIEEPQTNGGYLYARVPVEWVKINPPKKVEMTDERKERLRENLKNARDKLSQK